MHTKTMTSTHLPRWFRLNNNMPTTESFNPRLTPQCLNSIIFNPRKWKPKNITHNNNNNNTTLGTNKSKKRRGASHVSMV